jgi:large subunit ribosomal protein L25
MAGEIPDLNVTARAKSGKGAARQARRDGLVPGVVYGGGEEAMAINIPYNVLFKKLKAGRFLSTLFNLKVEGQEDVRVICRNVQRDVVKDLPTHLDLMRLKRTTKIALFIPVEYEGEDDCPGIRKGGMLSVMRPEVELVVTAGDIPEKLTVSIAGLEIGDTITISAIDLPKGAKPTIERDFVIANIQAPAGLASSDDDEDSADDAEAPAAEGGEE